MQITELRQSLSRTVELLYEGHISFETIEVYGWTKAILVSMKEWERLTRLACCKRPDDGTYYRVEAGMVWQGGGWSTCFVDVPACLTLPDRLDETIPRALLTLYDEGFFHQSVIGVFLYHYDDELKRRADDERVQ